MSFIPHNFIGKVVRLTEKKKNLQEDILKMEV